MLAHSAEKILPSNVKCDDVSVSRFKTAATLQHQSNNYFSWLKSPSESLTPSVSPSRPSSLTPSVSPSRPSSPSQPNVGGEDEKTTEVTEESSITDLLEPSSLSKFREFRGVQNLKHLWDKRISETKNNNNKQTLNPKTKNRTKSIGCLIAAANSVTEATNEVYETDSQLLLAQHKRAQSLHDCTDLGDRDYVIDTIHRKKDNFYKYKTAALLNFSVEPSTCAQTQVGVWNRSKCNFPAFNSTEKGDRIHWMKREDIVITAAKYRSTSMSSDDDNIDGDEIKEVGLESHEPENESSPSSTGKHFTMGLQQQEASVIDDDVRQTQQQQSATSSQTSANEGKSKTIAVANTNSSPQRSSSNANTLPSSSSTNSLKSNRSGDSLSVTRVRKNVNQARKYSFKTHAKNYHTPRKMYTSSSSSSSSGSVSKQESSGIATAIGNGNMVAKLTQQFNEIIQKDKNFLNEVKRKNGILMSRGGHVYKVVEKTQLAVKANQQSNGCPATAASTLAVTSTVRQNIKKFEENVTVAGISEKPKIPLKSIQVMNKRKEFVLPVVRNHMGKRLDAMKNFDLKTQSGLEEIQEEAKTPQDVEDKPLIAIEPTKKLETQQVDQLTKEDSKVNCCLAADELGQNEWKILSAMNSVLEIDGESISKTKREPPEGQEDEAKHVDCSRSATVSPAEKSFSNCPEECREQNIVKGIADEELADEEKMKQRKYKYSKIYEKFRFRSHFGGGAEKKSPQSGSPSPQKTKTDLECPNVNICLSENHHPESKILDALEEVNRKLKGLSTGKSFLLAEDDDFEQRILPNQSFIFQLTSKNSEKDDCDTNNIAQALNTVLVNAIGEQTPEAKEEPITTDYNIMTTLNRETPGDISHSHSSLRSRSPSMTVSIELTNCSETTGEVYEPIELTTTNIIKTEETGVDSFDDIYQRIEDKNKFHDDYESIVSGSSEQKLAKSKTDDGYEICEPTNSAPITTDMISKPDQSQTHSPPVRNTTDELPELPKPKRILPKSLMHVPPGRPISPSPPVTTVILTTVSVDDAIHHDHHYYADDENIYDTIKGSHCYESLQSTRCHSGEQKSLDSVSLISNCYESISNYRRNQPPSLSTSVLQKAGSTSTISSDQKTNSLYGVSMPPGCAVSGIISGLNNSNVASSDNSDEWVDISDSEANPIAKQQFIVIRERSKTHRSPDWSKRVRDQRLQKSISYFEDDSDHYYEPLFPLGNKRHSSYNTSEKNTHHKRNQDLPSYVPKHSKHLPHLRRNGNRAADDYDSFDTDADDVYDTEENWKNHNDSGVDIRNVKQLPEPPQPTNQVYAFVKRVKNFIANKKSPTSTVGKTIGSGNNNSSQQKIYENSSQFYVDGNEYQNTPKPPHRSKSAKPAAAAAAAAAKKSALSVKEDDGDYENTDFHSPPTLVDASTVAKLSNSEKSLLAEGPNNLTVRSKSKSGKSFKSRLRKSLVGTTFDAGTLITTRSTFYISDDMMNEGSGELDSGFSEKVSSGDLNGNSGKLADTSVECLTIARKMKRDANLLSTHRRRTIIGIRPNDPPPPPPLVSMDDNQSKLKSRSTTTSWYAECGVFKTGTAIDQIMNEENCGRSMILNGNPGLTSGGVGCSGPTTSWYTEAGLYQTSGASVASSSGSSGVSTGNEASPGDDMPHSMFLNEPLYQIYSAAKLESISRDMEDNDGSTDGYEEIGQTENLSETVDSERPKCTRPSALQLVGPKYGPSRTLWSEIPEVINSVILPTLTPRERGLQEAKFEVITSEASYLKSLNLLRSHFMNHPVFRDTSIVSARDRKSLFAHIVPVHECSERLLYELESCWQDNIMLLGLSKKIYNTAEKHFHVYISFCEQQGRMDRTLRHLKEVKGTFSHNLDLLESSPICCGLNLHSFLMLPMQRITRLPLLIDAIFSKLNSNDDEYENWKMTLAIMNKIVAQCNEAANRCEQAYEIERISRQLEFPSTIRALAIAPAGVPVQGSKPRFLVKRGELTHLIWRGDDVKLTFGKKFTKTNIYAFLFSDLLVLTKRKAEELFQVFDYCPRNMLTISSGDVLPQLPTKDMNQTGKNLILMTLLENNERKTVELVLSCPSVSEQERWLQAMRPPEAETPGEKLYEQWDCPQVVAKHSYQAKEPDLLSLEVGDVINVSRKLLDGWYQGERIRDGAVGWFPGSFTEEVNSAHVRARNLKQRYRLLTFTASYLESQKRK